MLPVLGTALDYQQYVENKRNLHPNHVDWNLDTFQPLNDNHIQRIDQKIWHAPLKKSHDFLCMCKIPGNACKKFTSQSLSCKCGQNLLRTRNFVLT